MNGIIPNSNFGDGPEITRIEGQGNGGMNLELTDASVEELLEVLALFFLRTSIWLRLDRLDGIGELEWADRFVLMPICHGLNQGLAHSAGQLGMPVDIVEPAQAFLMAHSNDELVRLAITMLEKWKAGEAEKNFIMPRLVGHIADLRNIR